MTSKNVRKIVYSVIKANPRIRLSEIEGLFAGILPVVTLLDSLDEMRKALEVSIDDEDRLTVFDTSTDQKPLNLLERKNLFFKIAIKLKTNRIRLEPNWLVIMKRLKEECPDDGVYEALCSRYLRYDEESPSMTAFYRYATTHGKRK